VIGINTSTYQPDEKDEGATAISLAEPLPAVCRIIDLLKAGTDTRLRMLPIATAVSGDDLRPRVAQVFQSGLGFKSGDIITKANGALVTSLPELLSSLRGLNGDAAITVQREGETVEVRSPVRIIPDPLKVRSINLSGLIIAEPWRLDDFEINPDRNLVIDWYESGEAAALTDAKVTDHIVSVDGQTFKSVDALYSYLDALPADASVDLMLQRWSSASEFLREYVHISLTKQKLEWVSVQ
jgi:S1-C subfamily serine protease